MTRRRLMWCSLSRTRRCERWRRRWRNNQEEAGGGAGEPVDWDELIPRLHFFYGQAPHPSGDWAQVPTDEIWKYGEAITKLESRQALDQIWSGPRRRGRE